MFVKLCDKTLLAIGELRSFKVRGHEVLAAHVEGKIYCLDSRCTHAGAPLSEGNLNGEVLTCPWHYSQFNVTNGDVIRGPANKPLRTYKVEEKENVIFVDL
jgi:3-phenylpropionate/trans-cinnamate dioxygenase ferredoxin component